MSIVYTTFGDIKVLGFQRTESILSGQTGDIYIVFPMPIGKQITCKVIAGVGTGRIEETTSSIAEIQAGTATWDSWAKGNITGRASDILTGSVTAIRGVSVSGNITIEIVI